MEIKEIFSSNRIETQLYRIVSLFAVVDKSPLTYKSQTGTKDLGNLLFALDMNSKTRVRLI